MNIERVIAAMSVIMLLVSIAGCSHSTKPKEVKYSLYVGAAHFATGPEDSTTGRILILTTDSLILVDSVCLPHIAQDFAVSADGQWVFVKWLELDHGVYDGHLSKINVLTKQTAWSRTGYKGADLRFMGDGKLLLIGNTVVQSEDGAIVQEVGDSLSLGWGPESGMMLAALASDPVSGGTVIHAFDLASAKLSGKYVARLSSGVPLTVLTARLHSDGRRILALGSYGSVDYSWFVVGDIQTGQTLFEYRIYRPLGETDISEDGATAVVTDPGTTAFGENGQAHIIDLVALKRIGPTVPIYAGQVRIVPNTFKVITAPLPDAWARVFLQTFDLRTMIVEATLELPGEPGTGRIAVRRSVQAE